MTREERWKHIEVLSDLRTKYSCFEENEELYYSALSAGIKAIKALEQEPCEDAINRQAVLEVLKDKWGMFSDANDAMQESIDTIEALSNVSPQPKTGHWNIKNNMWWVCSDCGCQTRMMKKYNVPRFCPCCGAKMIEPQESEGEE